MKRLAICSSTLLFAGCASAPPRVVQTPSVCPAPRALPASTLASIDALPDALPPLPASAASTDAAPALYALGAADAASYQACRIAARGAAQWIRDGGQKAETKTEGAEK
jgi:hypothetical protein